MRDSIIHRRLAQPVVHQMLLHLDDHQWATGGPPDVASSSGPPDVALVVGTRMLACGCNADADIKWLTGCTHAVVHWICTHAVVHRMRHIRWTTLGTFPDACGCDIRWSTSGLLVDHRMCKSPVPCYALCECVFFCLYNAASGRTQSKESASFRVFLCVCFRLQLATGFKLEGIWNLIS